MIKETKMKRCFIMFVILFMLLGVASYAQEAQQILLNDTGYGATIWIQHSSATNATSLTVTKEASTTDRWFLTDFSVGATQNGHVDVKVNGVQKWRLYFIAGTSTGQKVVIPASAVNQSIQLVITLNVAGNISGNMRGSKW